MKKKNFVKMQELKIQYLPVIELKAATYNPRFWPETTRQQMCQSFEANGCVQPILCNSAPNRKNVVINGHLRLQTAIDLGYTKVPVIFVEVPNIEEEKKLNLTLNRIAGEWDFEKLKAFDIGLLLESGFDDADLAHIWDQNLGVEDDDFDSAEEAKKIKTPKTKPGQMFRLGSHYLICGNSQDPNVVKKLVGTHRMDMINCDSPYNIGLSYDTGIGGTKQYGGKQTNDSKSDEEFKKFLKTSMENGLAVAKKDCHIFYYCDERYVWVLQTLYRELGLDSKRLCFWLKNNGTPTPQIAFNKVVECCCYATQGSPFLNTKVTNLNEILNKEVTSGNRLPDDVMDLLQLWLVKRLPAADYGHPTEKSPTLHEKALRRCTKPGDCVLDMFGGSGSLMSACEQLKRRSFLVEIEPVFCDLQILRYERNSHEKAILLN
jgi:DNA modification methylase